jgi:hypothetical protein
MRDSQDSSLAGLRRKLTVYRSVLAAVVVLQLGFLWFGRPATKTIQVVDLPAEIARMALDPAFTDLSQTFYASKAATVHLHLMGRTQRCPLHIHATEAEVTAIVDGTAHVSHVFGQSGGLARVTRTFTRGDIIQSPPSCGHEWVNPSEDSVLGNLVFASPPFSGNLYVTADDARMKGGAGPTLFRTEDAMSGFRQGGEATTVTPLTALARGVRLITTKRPFPIESAKGTVVFIREGHASIRVAGQTFPMGPAYLAIVRDHGGVTLVPTGNEPLLLLIFDAD